MLPNPVRYATLATLALGALVSFNAVQHLSQAISITSLDLSMAESPTLNKLMPNPAAWAAAERAQAAAYRNAIESMRGLRIAVLIALSSAASAVLVAAMRIRWPGGVIRQRMAFFLSRAALVAAFLRTLAGAQELAIDLAQARAFEKSLLDSGVDQLWVGNNVAVLTAASAVMTLVVVGLFITASGYFNSDRIQQTFALIDRNAVDD